MTQYYSNSKEEYVNINDMHHQHVWYAFKKLCDRLEELALTQSIWDDAFNPVEFSDTKTHGEFENPKGYVRKDVYEMLFDKCERLEKNAKILEKNVLDARFTPKATSNQVFKLERTLSEERTTAKELFRTVKRLRQQIKDMYAKQSHSAPRYYFSEIPNDGFGRDFVDNLKTFLNKDRYKLRVRGQYLDKSKLRKNETWRNYDDGQPLSKSKCIRVYIDQKKEK